MERKVKGRSGGDEREREIRERRVDENEVERLNGRGNEGVQVLEA